MTLRNWTKKWVYGSFPGFAGSFPYYGTKVYFPKGSVLFEEVCKQGIWERELITIISALAKPNTSYFDIGANIGLTSIPILSNSPDCQVISFEPSPGALPYLQRTNEQSRYGKRWLTVGKALADYTGSIDFYAGPSSASAFDGIVDTKRRGAKKKITVPVTTLDAEWAALNYPSVSVIKIDIEGAEIQALQGARECITKEQPFIVMEWASVNLTAYDCDEGSILRIANELDYSVFSLPNFVPVVDSMVLKLQMLFTESFIMIPKGKSVAKIG